MKILDGKKKRITAKYFFLLFFSLGSSSQFRSLEEGYIIARPVNVA